MIDGSSKLIVDVICGSSVNKVTELLLEATGKCEHVLKTPKSFIIEKINMVNHNLLNNSHTNDKY